MDILHVPGRWARISITPTARNTLILWGVSRAAIAFVLIGYLLATHHAVNGTGVLALWDQWDSKWYVGIAQHGYTSILDTAFFPLYPLLIHVLSLGTQQAVIAAIFISNAACLAICFMIQSLAPRVGMQSIAVILTSPMAFFFAAPYTDALFLALALGAFMLAQRKQWIWCAVVLFAAGLTRSTSIILIIPLALIYAQHHDWPRAIRYAWPHRRWLRAWLLDTGVTWRTFIEFWLVLCAVPMALMSYATFCAVRFGDPLSFVHAQHFWWLRQLSWPWQTIGLAWRGWAANQLWSGEHARILLDVGLWLLCLIMTIVAWGSWPQAYRWYMVGLLIYAILDPVVAPGFWVPLISVGRYLLAAFPVWLTIARANRVALWAWCIVMSAVQVWCILLYLPNPWHITAVN